MIEQLNQIISILEAQIPANPASPANVRLAKRLEKQLSKYFKALADAFPYYKLETIYAKNVKESAASEANDFIKPAVLAFRAELELMLADHMAMVYIDGYTQTTAWAGLAFEGPPIEKAVAWSKTYAGKLVKAIDEETRLRLANVVSDGIKNKRGVPGISRDLRKSFTDMSKVRADMIARTETAQALGEGFLDSAKKLGVQGKSWVTAGDGNVSDECFANEKQGPIPLNQAFISGAMTPPQHPNCRCAVVPEYII